MKWQPEIEIQVWRTVRAIPEFWADANRAWASLGVEDAARRRRRSDNQARSRGPTTS